MPASPLRRASVTVAAATLVGLGALAAPAHAASATLSYTCTVFTLPDGAALPGSDAEALKDAAGGDLSGIQSMLDDAALAEAEGLKITATFDSRIADGQTAPVGSTIGLTPVKTNITFPAATVLALGSLDLDAAVGGSFLYAGIDETGEEADIITDFESIQASGGALTASGDGEAEPIVLREAGEHTLVAGDLDVILLDPESEDSFAGLECTLDDDQDPTIDVVSAVAPAPTPSTPAPAPGPVRPDVVQTDAAQPSAPGLPIGAAGAGTILAAGAATYLLRRRAVRH